MNFKLAGMGRKADIVHSDRLKPYPTPSKNAIRKTPADDQEEIRTTEPTDKDQAEKIERDTAELIDRIQAFLDPKQVITKTKKPRVPKQQPPPPL